MDSAVDWRYKISFCTDILCIVGDETDQPMGRLFAYRGDKKIVQVAQDADYLGQCQPPMTN